MSVVVSASLIEGLGTRRKGTKEAGFYEREKGTYLYYSIYSLLQRQKRRRVLALHAMRGKTVWKIWCSYLHCRLQTVSMATRWKLK